MEATITRCAWLHLHEVVCSVVTRAVVGMAQAVVIMRPMDMLGTSPNSEMTMMAPFLPIFTSSPIWFLLICSPSGRNLMGFSLG
jgi:hypothetical protein